MVPCSGRSLSLRPLATLARREESTWRQQPLESPTPRPSIPAWLVGIARAPIPRCFRSFASRSTKARSPRVAADRLLQRVDGDLAVLRHARARVLCRATDHPIGITRTNAVSLDRALSTGRLP